MVHDILVCRILNRARDTGFAQAQPSNVKVCSHTQSALTEPEPQAII